MKVMFTLTLDITHPDLEELNLYECLEQLFELCGVWTCLGRLLRQPRVKVLSLQINGLLVAVPVM